MLFELPTTSIPLELIRVVVTCCHGQTLLRLPSKKPVKRARVGLGNFLKAHESTREKLSTPTTHPSPKTPMINAACGSCSEIAAFAEGSIKVYIPIKSRIKEPDNPGSNNADIAITPEMKTNQS